FSIKLKYLTFLLSSVSAEDNGGSLDQFRCLCISILLNILPGCIMMLIIFPACPGGSGEENIIFLFSFLCPQRVRFSTAGPPEGCSHS
ncbi:hypothetical protein, partial [Escherichia coli]|uniref:hypothetical protein n=1 Tax=Escherichia coli TaxID=562 RepID=UPI001BC82F7A